MSETTEGNGQDVVARMVRRMDAFEEASKGGGQDIVARMVRRMDALEGQFTRLERERLRAMQGDIAAVKRAIEKLVAAKGESDGQPDWITCCVPQDAEILLMDVYDWSIHTAPHLGMDLIGCWPWHPAAVALLLAAKSHHAAVMTGDNALAVTDYLVRHLPGVEHRVRHVTKQCNDQQHKVGEAPFAYDPDRLTELAYWWASDRTGKAPGLTPWQERTDQFAGAGFRY